MEILRIGCGCKPRCGIIKVSFLKIIITQGRLIKDMKTKDLIAEAISLPVEERALIIDSLLKSLNPTESEMDKKWATLAGKRLEQLRSGEIQAIPGEEVFQKVWSRIAK
jgi:putative addiction module component (TIGR02574 family)